MSNKKDKTEELMRVTFYDNPDPVQKSKSLVGKRYEYENVNSWNKLGININRKGGKPPLEDFNDLED